MKIIFFGDSTFDAKRVRGSTEAGRIPEERITDPGSYGSGIVFMAATQLYYDKPNYYEILNRGIGGDRLPQMYARINLDVWREEPDVLTIIAGANDMPSKSNLNVTDIARWGRLYRMMIEETLERLPNVKIMLCETYAPRDVYREMVKPYVEETRKIAKEFNLPCVSFQDKVDEALVKYGLYTCFYDGGHPNLVGSKILADEWLRVFKEEVEKEQNY